MEDKLIRLSDADTLLRAYADQCHGIGKYEKASGVLSSLKHLVDIPGMKPNVVTQFEYDELNKKYQTLARLLKGEWVDCNDVQAALNITFDQGMKMFQFGRTASWNPAPLEGQKVTVKFRISEKTLEQTKMHDFEEEFNIQEAMVRAHTNPDSHQWELILEQQGGII